jgi:hypothetical protein
MLTSKYIDTINMGFVFKGTTIVNEYVDETMRVRVTPLDYYGDAYVEFLHELARALMEDINNSHGWNFILSLDEYYAEVCNDITPYETKLIIQLLESF